MGSDQPWRPDLTWEICYTAADRRICGGMMRRRRGYDGKAYGLGEVGLQCRVRNVVGCDVGWEEGVAGMCVRVCGGCV